MWHKNIEGCWIAFKLAQGLYQVKYSIMASHDQCRRKGNISGGARKCWRGEPLGGSGGMLPQKNLKSRGLQMLFPAFSKSYL